MTESVSVASQFVRQTVDPVAVYRAALYELEQRQPDLYVENHGFVAFADFIGYRSNTLKESVDVFDIQTRTRVARAKTYMEEVGGALSKAGQAHGILANAIRASEDPSKLTKEQLAIWGSQANGGTLLIQRKALIDCIKAIASVQIAIGDQVQSGAQILAEQFANIGIAEAQMWTTLMATAAKGTLAEQTFGRIFATLNCESANFEELPTVARTAAAAFREAFLHLRTGGAGDYVAAGQHGQDDGDGDGDRINTAAGN